MSLYCDIVMDLIALYHDGLASNETRKQIELHLQHCDSCKFAYKQYHILCPNTMRVRTIPSESMIQKDFSHLAKRMRKKRLLVQITMSLYICISFLLWFLVVLRMKKNIF